MKIKNISIIVILLLIGLVRPALAADPAKQVEKFLIAVQKRDFKTIFALSAPYLSYIDYIKRTNPQIFWDQKINEYFNSQKEKFDSDKDRFQDGNSFFKLIELKRFLPPDAKIKVIEVRRGEVFVQIDYNSIAHSPITNMKGNLRSLKKAILVVYVSDGGIVSGYGTYQDGFIVWPEEALRIVKISWSADGLSGVQLDIKTSGGTPPIRATTDCGSLDIKKLNGFIQRNVFRISKEELEARVKEYFPLTCTTTATDASGKSTTVSFKIAECFTGVGSAFCWVNPYFYDGDAFCNRPLSILDN
jgi:hypothetical protein